jgi:initiation factor 1A
MGKNQIGGKKHKRGQNHDNRRAVIYADGKDTIYAMILRPLGDCRFSVVCNDGVERIGVVRGALYKNTFIATDDIVLVGLREFQTDSRICDIIFKYQAEDIADLRATGTLVGKLANKRQESDEVCNFDFVDTSKTTSSTSVETQEAAVEITEDDIEMI